jgi:DNA polymerase-3 subunit beta
MKCIVKKVLLAEALTNVSRVIAAKSSIPALEGVQLKAYQNTLTLTGFDLESGITTFIEAGVEVEGEIVLPARLFSDMTRKMDCDEILIEISDKHMAEIVGGAARFSILGIPSEEFPELPHIKDGENVDVSQSALKSMLEQTLFAVAQTDTKPIHTGSLFDLEPGKLTVVSVDGYRLALRSEDVKTDKKMNFVVPGKVLSEIVKLLRDDKENKEESTSITVSKRHATFAIGSYKVITRLLEGDFLDYKQSIPSGGKTIIKVGTREMIEGVERASLLINDRLRSPIRVVFSDEGSVQISCSTPLGKSYDEVGCSIEGEALEMGFNNKYILDALKAADCDKVKIEISGPLSPIKVLPPEGEGFLFLVLPVRLKND